MTRSPNRVIKSRADDKISHQKDSWGYLERNYPPALYKSLAGISGSQTVKNMFTLGGERSC